MIPNLSRALSSKYTETRVCLSVCLSACLSFPRRLCPKSRKRTDVCPRRSSPSEISCVPYEKSIVQLVICKFDGTPLASDRPRHSETSRQMRMLNISCPLRIYDPLREPFWTIDSCLLELCLITTGASTRSNYWPVNQLVVLDWVCCDLWRTDILCVRNLAWILARVHRLRHRFLDSCLKGVQIHMDSCTDSSDSGRL